MDIIPEKVDMINNRKILSMYAKGMTTGDIEAHIQDIYGLAVSDTTVSRITDKILPVAKEWQQRPLELIYGPAVIKKKLILGLLQNSIPLSQSRSI